MHFLIYTHQKSQQVIIPDDRADILSDILHCLTNNCTQDYASDGIVHLLNVEKTLVALTELSNRHKAECASIQRFPAALKGLSEGEGFFVVDEGNASLVTRRAAAEALQYSGNWKERYDDVWKRLNALTNDFHFLSFGFDGIPVSIGEPDKSKRVCRFCGAVGAEHFGDKAHAIQDSLGNKLLVCYEECDDCNHTLNCIEDNFLVMMDVRRSLFHISRKNSAKSARVVGENFMIEPDANGIAQLYVMQEKIPAGVGSPFMMRLNHKTNITNEKMYKALVKMVVDLVPSEAVPHFKNTVKWIGDNNWCPDALPTIWFAESKTHFYEQPVLDVFIKRDDSAKDVPYCTAILWIYDVMYMYIVPLVDVDAGRYKYDKNLTEHWQAMMRQLGNRKWFPQNGSDYTPATVWVDMPIDTSSPQVHIRPMADAFFSDCLKTKREPDLVNFPVLDETGIHLVGVVKADFTLLYEGKVSQTDLTDITIHASAPTFVLFPLKRQIKFLMNYTCSDTTDTVPYFSVEMKVVFELDNFRSNLEWTVDENGDLLTCAFDYHLRDYIYARALIEAETILAKGRAGTPFASCTTEKLIDNQRLLDGAVLMIPTNAPNSFWKVNLVYHF